MANTSTTSRSVLITGGGRGIGLAIAHKLMDQGHKVAVTYFGDQAPEGVFGVPCDVRDTDSIDAAFAQVEEAQGPVEVLVANAGITKDMLIIGMKDQAFDDVIDTNLAGAFRVARRAAKKMIRGRFGRLIFMSSVSALSGAPGQANYGASKAGLIGLSRSLARELGSRNITSNVIAPGFIETDMTKDLPEKTREIVVGATPLGRTGQPEDVAAAVAWLASDDAAFISGAVIPVDGGLGMGH